jgi:hypothetical protein
MIEVLKQAYQLLLTEPHAPTVCDQLEIIFRRAIAELESQEPVGEVGWLAHVPNTIKEVYWEKGSPPIGTKLYTHPPQRTWVGLTDEEIDDIFWQHESRIGHQVPIYPYERAIEAKLKEKNT